MNIRLISSFVLLIYTHNISSAEFSAEDAWVLENFLRYTFTEESFGYVLEQEKPMSGTGYYVKDLYYPGIPAHKRNTLLREGSRVWHQYFPNPSTHWILTDSQSSTHPNLRFLSLTYLPLLEAIIQENLPLFNALLGPHLTSKELAIKLSSPHVEFTKELKHSNLLIGIVLGYGSQNAILVSRSEELVADKTLESPPNKKIQYRQLQFFPATPVYKKKCSPSTGFTTIDEEFSFLSAQTNHASPALLEESPNLLFGWKKGCEETPKRIARLEKSQKKIQALLAQTNFAESVISKITGKNIPLKIQKPNIYPSLSRAIANSCFEIWENCTQEFYRGVIEGMADSNLNHEPRVQNKMQMNENQQTHLLKTALATRSLSESYIASLDSSYQKLIPNKLAYKITKEGKGEFYQNQKNVKLHLTLTMGPYHYPLYHSEGAQEFDLTETIPGLAHALQGMKEGELRDVIIHSDYGYGVYTNLERGQWMTATIEFVQGIGNEKIEMPEPLQEDILSEKKMTQIQYEAGYVMGYLVWNHYKQHPAPSFEEVKEILSKGRCELNISPEERQQLDRLHIEIYNKKHQK